MRFSYIPQWLDVLEWERDYVQVDNHYEDRTANEIYVSPERLQAHLLKEARGIIKRRGFPKEIKPLSEAKTGVEIMKIISEEVHFLKDLASKQLLLEMQREFGIWERGEFIRARRLYDDKSMIFPASGYDIIPAERVEARSILTDEDLIHLRLIPAKSEIFRRTGGHEQREIMFVGKIIERP